MLVHKQMYWIRTNLQPSNVKCNNQMFILHYMMEYVGNLCNPCILVPYISSQKGEFMFLGSAQYNYVCA